MTVNLGEHLLDMKGKAYLPVAPRVAWWRERNPDAAIVTEFKQYGDQWLAVAYVQDADGNVLAKAHKEVTTFKAGGRDASWTKAETGAVGRALSLCGVGTLQALDLDEGDEIADTPVERARSEPHDPEPEDAPDTLGIRDQCIAAIEAKDEGALDIVKGEIGALSNDFHKAAALRWYTLARVLVTGVENVDPPLLRGLAGHLDGLPDDAPGKGDALDVVNAALDALKGRGRGAA